MKKYALFTLLSALASWQGFAGAIDFAIDSSLEKSVSSDVKVIKLEELTEIDLQEIFEGKHPHLAIEFTAYTQLPLHFYLKGDLVRLTKTDDEWTNVEILQTFYLRSTGEAFFISFNRIDWKPFMEAITGNASLGLCVQDGKPSIMVGSETNRRD